MQPTKTDLAMSDYRPTFELIITRKTTKVIENKKKIIL